MSRRCKLLVTSNQLFALMLRAGRSHYEVIQGEAPEDARIVAAEIAGLGREVHFLLESDSFDEVPEGQPWPWIVPIIRRVDEPTPCQAAPVLN